MASDITVTGSDVYNVNINYNGSTITTASGTFTKTLPCAGKVMATDVGVVVIVTAPVPNTITVAGLGNSDPSTVTFTTSGTFNWNFEEVTINSNVFIKIPTMYRKVEAVSNNQITSFTLADAQVDSSYQPYPCFVNGNSVLPYVLIGKYYSSSTTTMNSVNATQATQTLENGRTNARKLGTGYQLYDWQFQKLFTDLAMCYVQRIKLADGATVSECLGISQLNIGCWVDGYYTNGRQVYVAANPDNYVSVTSGGAPTGYVLVSTIPTDTSFRCVKQLSYPSNMPFFNMGNNIVTDSVYNTYYRCGMRYNSGYHPVYTYVGGNSSSSGFWFWNTVLTWTASYPVRLCYRPI